MWSAICILPPVLDMDDGAGIHDRRGLPPPPSYRSRRIVHVNDVAGVAQSLVRGLRDAGHDAQFMDIRKLGARWSYPWKLAAAPIRLALLAGLAARIRAMDPDITHIHYASQGIVGKFAGRPYVIHCHGTDVRFSSPRSRWGRLVGGPLRDAAGVIYATPDLETWVSSFRPDARFLPGPIDTDAFRPRPVATSADVLVSTRLDPIKGADTIISIATELRQRRPGTIFTVVDHGFEAGRLRAALGTAARLIPKQPRDRMAGLLSSHRLFLGQFGVGAIGQAELEAMASGVPVTASFAYPGAYDLQPPIINATDPEFAADAMAELLEAPPRRAAVAAAGRDWVVAHHSVPRVAERLLDDYAAFGLMG
jgi:glycosyltransferase involved in cell wall biosynthesis